MFGLWFSFSFAAPFHGFSNNRTDEAFSTERQQYVKCTSDEESLDHSHLVRDCNGLGCIVGNSRSTLAVAFRSRGGTQPVVLHGGLLSGFLFTSYGEETGTAGKVRDWVIGGITGLTIAKASAVKGLLLTFAAGPGASEFALTVTSAVVYAILGFFFMFFQRELILNVLLAQSRAERGRIEGVRQVGQVIKSFLVRLPASILSGVDDIDQISAVNKQEADRLRGILYSDEVNAFLDQAETSVQGDLDWDVVSKAAYIQYYRTYFEKDDKVGQAKRAIDWITRALFMNPQHADLTMEVRRYVGYTRRLRRSGEHFGKVGASA